MHARSGDAAGGNATDPAAKKAPVEEAMPPLKDLLGKPGEGVHFHLFGIAIVDVVLTVVGALLLDAACRWARGEWGSFWATAPLWFAGLFALGEVLHIAIGVDTTVARLLRKLVGGLSDA